MELDQLLDALRITRGHILYYKAYIKEMTDTFRESIKDTIDDLNSNLEEEDRLRNKITEIALDIYYTDHTKDIHPKIKERDITTLHYDDTEALQWCLQHSLFLHVDKKRLEGYIRSLKGVGVPGFVTVEVVPSITIAQEL